MDYEERDQELYSLANSVAELVRTGTSFREAFGYRFRLSGFNFEERDMIKIAVGSILRSKGQKHPPQPTLSGMNRSTPTSAIR